MKDGLVSIVIPAHKAEKYIVESLESIFKQTYSRWEIILWEDGAFDKTADIVKQLRTPNGQPLRLFRNETNCGVSFTRNRAMEKAEGEYIAFMDADDTWECDHLELALKWLEREQAGMCFSGNNFIDEDGHYTKRNELPSGEALKDIPNSIYNYNFIMVPAVLIRRKIVDSGLRFDEELSYGEDLDFWLQIIANGFRVAHSPHASYNYRKHTSSAMAQTLKMVEGMLGFYEKNYSNELISIKLRNQQLKESLYVHGRLIWRIQPALGFQSFCKLLRLSPANPKYIFWTFLSFLYSTCYHRNPQHRVV